MKKKALRKDFYMEIRRSLGRFLSIFFIVAIGCAFFSGIRASEPDMRYSGDEYFDNKNMMDIQVISTMGLTEEDVSAIEAVDGIEYAEGGYSSDLLCTDGANQIVVHVMAILPTRYSWRTAGFRRRKTSAPWMWIIWRRATWRSGIRSLFPAAQRMRSRTLL